MMYSINAKINSNNEIIIIINAKIGNKLRNAGIQRVNNLFKALISLNGFIKAHRTSIIQIISSRIGRKNLYSIKNGMNWSNSFIIASNTSLPKLGFNWGFKAPGGMRSCNLSKRSNKSSGNPSGNGFKLGRLREKG